MNDMVKNKEEMETQGGSQLGPMRRVLFLR